MEMEKASPAPESAGISPIGRMAGALFNPKETFTDIVRKPSWIAPMALFIVLGLGFSWMMNQRVDWPNFIRQQAEKNKRFQDLPEEQKQRALGPQIKFAPMFAYAIGAVGSPILITILGLFWMLVMNAAGGAGVNFKQSFGIAAHACMPTAIFSVLGLITMSLKKFGDVDPEHLLASNLGAFLADDAPRWLASLGQSFEVFWIWVLILLAVGYSAANPKKLSVGKAAGIIIGVWLVWVFAKAGLATAFS